MKMLGNWHKTYQHGGEDGTSVDKKTARNREEQQWIQDYKEEMKSEDE